MLIPYFRPMPIHIGSFIKHMAEERKYSQQELGDLISRSKQNVGDIYRRHSIDSDLLYRFCCIFEYDFFALYLENSSFKSSHQIDLEQLLAKEKVLQEQLRHKDELLESMKNTLQVQQTAISLLEERLGK